MNSFFSPLARSSTYRRFSYLLLGLPLGVLYFTLIVTGISLAGGLLVIWVGVPILIGTVLGWRALGRFERNLAIGMLDARVAPLPASPRGGSWSERFRALFGDSYTWRSLSWLMLRFPLGIIGFVAAIVAIAVPLALIAAPLVLLVPDLWGANWLVDTELGFVFWLAALLGVVLLAGGAHVINGLGTLHARLAERLLGPSLREQQAVLRKRAEVAEERIRLGHELHDSVGHTLTMNVVQAGAARHVFDRDPDFARQALENIESSGRRALAELDRILGLLRDDESPADRAPLPDLGRLPDLVDEVSTAGLPVRLQVEGTLTDLPTPVSRSAYRIVQEALTNVARHAGSVDTEVMIHRTAGALELEVLNGPPQAPANVGNGGPGRGLVGIRERVSLLGGTVEAGERPNGGFRLWTRLPVNGS